MSLKNRRIRTISLVLISSFMISSFPISTFALSDNDSSIILSQDKNISVNILEDNSEKRVVEVISNDTKTVVTYDKINNIITGNEINLNTAEKNYINIDLNDTSSYDNDNSISSRKAQITNSSRFSKIYYAANGKKWSIKNTKGSLKGRTETSKNSVNLYRFKDAVDSCRKLENASSRGMDATKLGLAIAGVTAETGVGAVIGIFTAIGGASSAAYKFYDSLQYRKEADRLFSML
ncbi:TPA: geobacillin-26 family protein [Clostridioides difficile]|nr:geobacillin-26 family protein [Clostridioides difficile]